MDETEVKQNIAQLKKEIHSLSAQLKQLDEQKEQKYKEKENINQELNTFIKSAKELRDKKKNIDSKIKELKGKRQILNKEISEMYSKFGHLKKSFAVTPTRPIRQIGRVGSREKFPPEKIRKQIEQIEFSIQTDTLSFDREKKYMQQLRELKAELQQIQLDDEKFREIKDFGEKINTKQTEADAIHAEIQNLASESSEMFGNLTEKSEHIANAKRARESINLAIQKLKGSIDGTDEKLAELLQQWSALTSSPFFIAQETIPDIQKKAEQTLEKLKAKGKLTKDDILAMQKAAIRKR